MEVKNTNVISYHTQQIKIPIPQKLGYVQSAEAITKIAGYFALVVLSQNPML